MGPVQLPRETEDNDNAKLWSDKQRALWYVMVFLEWSIGPEAGNDFHGRLARASIPSPLACPVLSSKRLLRRLPPYIEMSLFSN